MLRAANLRPRSNPSLPSGYYGNAIVVPAAMTTVEKFVRNPLGECSGTSEASQSKPDNGICEISSSFNGDSGASKSYFIANIGTKLYGSCSHGDI
ncbi:hypothetical protein F3Y22_tig00001120pilonHSYRG00400 [Hibiscus syriacus]|uniref:Uncharacterized protein n=1 Tax=Hibiscus syriacus TaxID=106335 RepID=A0A6A3CWG0_HIBSY|nr:hypothetical protein F3Y22_tig00001120pilonHSYRG00400 [Hibiscus syriacus]